MSLYLLTTKFPPGMLKSPELPKVTPSVRSAYGTMNFSIRDSYVVSDDTALDIVEAPGMEAAQTAAKAIEAATGTKITVAQITRWNSHIHTL